MQKSLFTDDEDDHTPPLHEDVSSQMQSQFSELTKNTLLQEAASLHLGTTLKDGIAQVDS